MKIPSFFNRYVFILMLALLGAGSLPVVAAEKGATKAVAVSPVNVNTASVEALAKALKGVGLKKAEAIVSYRDKHGRFASFDELQKVRGIGEEVLTRNRKLIKFR